MWYAQSRPACELVSHQLSRPEACVCLFLSFIARLATSLAVQHKRLLPFLFCTDQRVYKVFQFCLFGEAQVCLEALETEDEAGATASVPSYIALRPDFRVEHRQSRSVSTVISNLQRNYMLKLWQIVL